MSLDPSLQITGVEINYYFVCIRKLWFFSHGLGMEHSSILVEIGKEMHNESYRRDNKEIMIDNIICLDFIEKELIVNETKLSKSMKKATKFQLLYYLYYLESKGVRGLKGVIRYPKIRQTEELNLTEECKEMIFRILKDIKRIKSMKLPPTAEKDKKCCKCSYHELCFC